MKRKHVCPNRFNGEDAKGGCFFEIQPGQSEGMVQLDVGWSCVVVHQKEIPVSWLAELIAIATDHKDGVAGFLAEHQYSGESYALYVDPRRIQQSDRHLR